MTNYFFDENRVRYDLAASHPGHNYNWLFFPGGPGADSRYFYSLIELLQLPGNVWLVDMPANGDNTQDLPENYNFNWWLDNFVSIVLKFPNPVVVGHSFGAMMPLLNPILEKHLKGFVVLNSAPNLWLEEAVTYARQFKLPDLTDAMQQFTVNPSQDTFNVALDACLPYYFPAHSLAKGRTLLEKVPFNYKAAVWGQIAMHSMNYSAKWVPEKVPTLIVSGTYDCIVPYKLFQQDKRFHRPNIKMHNVQDGGHLGWIESPEEIQTVFKQFCNDLIK